MKTESEKFDAIVDELIEIIAEKDFENLEKNLVDTVKGLNDKSIIEAFRNATGGEFVEHKSFPGCKILNKFPNIILRTIKKKKTISFPFMNSKSYYIQADQKRPCYKIAWTLNTNNDDTSGIYFKDENSLNYDFDNLTKEKPKPGDKKKKQIVIKKDENGNEIVEEVVDTKIDISDVKDSKIDIRERTTITNIRKKAPYNLSSKAGWIEVIKDLRSVFTFIEVTPEIFIFKDMVFDPHTKKSMMKIVTTDNATARCKLDKLFIGNLDGKIITGWDVFIRYTHLFAYSYLALYKPNDENVFNLFQGFYWNEIEELDEK